MPVEDFNLTEQLQQTLVSFDPDCGEYAFLRTAPIAIYVDAGDYDEKLAYAIASIVDEVMQEAGFEAPERLRRLDGSLILLNLSRAPEPLDEATFQERLGHVKNSIVNRLRKLPWGTQRKLLDRRSRPRLRSARSF